MSRQLPKPADLGTGTRDGTRFLRDDGAYAVPAGFANPLTAKGGLIVGAGDQTVNQALAANSPALAVSIPQGAYSGGNPAVACDGNDATSVTNGSWWADAGPWSLNVDLGVAKSIVAFRLKHDLGTSPLPWKIAYSNDNATWTDVYTSSNTAQDTGIVTLSGAPYSGRYWKVYINGPGNGNQGFRWVYYTFEIRSGVVAGTAVQLPVGTDGQVPTADSTAANGVSYGKEIVVPDVKVSGLTGATAASRYVGATATGAPTSGTFAIGDFVVAQNGHIWVCTVAGTPGTWVDAGAYGAGGGGGSITVQDEGVALPAETALNFVGAGVAATDNPGSARTDVTIPGPGPQDIDILFQLDGGGGMLVAGDQIMLSFDYAATITGIELFTPTSDTGTVQLDIRSTTYASYPTTTSIVASAPPAVTSGNKYRDTTLTGWTTAIAAGNRYFVSVAAVTGQVTKVWGFLKVQRPGAGINNAAGTFVVQNNGSALAQRSTLNFTSGLTPTDDPTNGRINLAVTPGNGVSGTFATRPAAGTAGRIHLPTDSVIGAVDTGSAWVPFYINPLVTPPALSNWTWTNQGTATADESKGGLYVADLAGTTLNMRVLTRPAPATPYTVTAAVLMPVIGGNNGLLWKDSATGRIALVRWYPDGNIYWTYYNSATSWSSNPTSVNYNNTYHLGRPFWVSMTDDGTNFIVKVSADGVHFDRTLWTYGRTAWTATPNQIGFCADAGSSIWLISWTGA